MGTPSTPAHELALSLRIAYKALHRATDAALADHGVTADQFVVLSALARGDALSQRDLVERTSSDPSTLRAMLVLLEEKGFVERQPHPRDGRARSVKLTARGRRAQARMWSATEPLRQQLGTAVGSTHAGALIASLRKIARVVEPNLQANGSPSTAKMERATSTKGT